MADIKRELEFQGLKIPLRGFDLAMDEQGSPLNGTLQLYDDGRNFQNATGIELWVGFDQGGTMHGYGPMSAYGEYSYNPMQKTTSLPVVAEPQAYWHFEDNTEPGDYATFGDLLTYLDPNLDTTEIAWLLGMPVVPRYLETIAGDGRGRKVAAEHLQDLGYHIMSDLPGPHALGVVVAEFDQKDFTYDAPYEFTGESRAIRTLPTRIVINGCDLDLLNEAISEGKIPGVIIDQDPQSHEGLDNDPKFTNPAVPLPTVELVDATPPANPNGDQYVPTETYKQLKISYTGIPSAFRTELQMCSPTEEQRLDMEAGLAPVANYPLGGWSGIWQAKGGEKAVTYVTDPGLGTYAFRLVPINPRRSVYRDSGDQHVELSYGTPGLPVKQSIKWETTMQLKATALDGRIALTWISQDGSLYRFNATQKKDGLPGFSFASPQPDADQAEFKGYGAAWLKDLDQGTVWNITAQRVIDGLNQVVETSTVQVAVPSIGVKVENLTITPSATGAKIEWRQNDPHYTLEVWRDKTRLVSVADVSLSPKFKVVDDRYQFSFGGLEPSTQYTLLMWPTRGTGWNDRLKVKNNFSTDKPPALSDKTAEERFAAGEIGSYTQVKTAEGKTTTVTVTRDPGANTISTTTAVVGEFDALVLQKDQYGKMIAVPKKYPDTTISTTEEVTAVDSDGRELTVDITKKGFGYRDDHYVMLTLSIDHKENTWNAEGYCVATYQSLRESELGPNAAMMENSHVRVMTDSFVRMSDTGMWKRTLSGYESMFGPKYNPDTGAIIGRQTVTRPIGETSIGFETPRRQKPKQAEEVNSSLEEPTIRDPAKPSWEQLNVKEVKSEVYKATEAAKISESKKRQENGNPKNLNYVLEVGGLGPKLEVNVPWAYTMQDLATIANHIRANLVPTFTRTRVYFHPVGARRSNAVKSVQIQDGEDGYSETVTTRSVE